MSYRSNLRAEESDVDLARLSRAAASSRAAFSRSKVARKSRRMKGPAGRHAAASKSERLRARR
jgi:hypothetical protein